MNAALASLAKRCFQTVGHYTRRLRDDTFPGVAVLCYHGVQADDWPSGTVPFEGLQVRAGELEAHCDFLRETCHPISLEDWRRALAGGPPLPPRPVLLTFDEAYHTLRTIVRPILARYAIPAVVFAWSEPIELRRLVWYDAVARASGEAKAERVKHLDYEQWRAVCAEHAREAFDGDPNAPLTIDELRALAATPGIEIAGHTSTHPILARASKAQQRHEIGENKAKLEEWTGRRVGAFAYPNGEPIADYTADAVDLVAEHGFDFGFTTRYRFATPDEPPLERSRFVMVAGVSAAELGHRLAYSWPR